MKKRKGRLFSRSCGAAVAAIMLFLCGCGPREAKFPMEKTGVFVPQPLPDYSSPSSYGAVTDLLGVNDVLAVYRNSTKAYLRAGIIETGSPLLYENEDGRLVLDGEGCARLLGKEGGALTDALTADSVAGYELTMYGGKMAVLTQPGNAPDPFDDLYTLEYVSLLLSGADEEELKNAFVKLPSKVTGGTNTVFYNLPDIDLGLQTSVYYERLGDANVKAGPAIVAGQGAHPDNYTLVRVFNRQQAKTAQFLAFPPDVRGGVRVSAVTYSLGDSEETLIAAAAFRNEGTLSDTVRVFDTAGVVRAAFVPDGIKAPYTLLSGRFAGGSGDEYLAVSGADISVSGGTATVRINIYSLADMTLRDTLVFEAETGDDGTAGNLTAELSIRPGVDNDGIIVYIPALNRAVVCDPVKKTAAPFASGLPGDATGVYSSAFGDGFIVTAKDEGNAFSYVYNYPGTVSGGDRMNVGWRENRFYSTFAADNPDGYVDRMTFNHVRTDLAAKILNRLGNPEKARSVLTDSDQNVVKNWMVRFTNSSKYHNSYNMWEPCFTHRWNRIQATQILSQVRDDDGNILYGSIGRDNAAGDYLELDSSFLVGTYADGILEMDKLRLHTLRGYLQSLSDDFRGKRAEPEKLVAVSPVHEQEINVAGSVGDYNVYMIRGFRNYLLGLYGSIDNINRRFGTPFASEADFDAPRFDPEQDDPALCRGEWDTYGKSDFFTQWSLYTRMMVNKRIMEAYREALLAGFPPEAINAHQIPEGDAVAGFLGEANTRLSPVEAVTVCGTAYGGTRYGLWYGSDDNFLNHAYKAGHNNITLGEYGSITPDRYEALFQLRYMLSHGCRAIHMIIPVSQESPDYVRFRNAEQYAIDAVQKENKPRTCATGLTNGSVPYNGNGFSFNIVQLGSSNEDGSQGVGLLKSVDSAGGWEGTVYLVPFHAAVDVRKVRVNGSIRSGFRTEAAEGMQCGDQVELTFNVANPDAKNAAVTVRAYNGEYPISASETTFTLGQGNNPCRFVFSNQLSPEGISIEVSFSGDVGGLSVSNMVCTAQYEDIAHRYFGDNESSPAAGGVTFDIIGRS